jgi:hypothetical protein
MDNEERKEIFPLRNNPGMIQGETVGEGVSAGVQSVAEPKVNIWSALIGY